MTKGFIALFSVLLLILPAPLAAATTVDLRWSELSAFLVRAEVHAVLKNGTEVKGRVLAVSGDELAVATRKGRVAVPRDTLGVLQMRELGGAAGRVTLSILGVILASGAASAIAANGDSNGAGTVVGVLGAMVGGGVGGYYAGKALDRKTTLIRILPD